MLPTQQIRNNKCTSTYKNASISDILQCVCVCGGDIRVRITRQSALLSDGCKLLYGHGSFYGCLREIILCIMWHQFQYMSHILVRNHTYYNM